MVDQITAIRKSECRGTKAGRPLQIHTAACVRVCEWYTPSAATMATISGTKGNEQVKRCQALCHDKVSLAALVMLLPWCRVGPELPL